MRDPRDALSRFFFGPGALSVMMLGALLVAVSGLVAGCAPERSAAEPASGSAVQVEQAAQWRSRFETMVHPDGSAGRFRVVTDAATGCEYLWLLEGGYEARMARADDGRMIHQGCRAGTFRENP